MFAPFTSSLRYTLPRVEVRARDRRSGAYPTKARTGDRTRTGRNKYYFDDTRTVMFMTGVSVSLPTTFHTGSRHLTGDLTSSFAVIGNTLASNVEQWISHREQVETTDPFVEDKLFEQDERSTLNSCFMTGAAFSIAPDHFKSGLANKTVIRIKQQLVNSTALTANSSSIFYLNTTDGKFDLVKNEKLNLSNLTTTKTSPSVIDPIMFTAYGYHNSCNVDNVVTTKDDMPKISQFVADGTKLLNFYPVSGGSLVGTFHTASLINRVHVANVTQSINMSNYLSQPFLVEKIVVEFPFAAGASWLNDQFTMSAFGASSGGGVITSQVTDVGGPMVTVALLRQDKTSQKNRDLIASGTISPALEMLTSSYSVVTASLSSSFGVVTADDIIITRRGLQDCVSASCVVFGTTISGSNNQFTGTVRLTMTPAVTNHVMRFVTSGSAKFNWFDATDVEASNFTDAHMLTFGSIGKRPGELNTGRSILGNHIALLNPNDVNASVNNVKTYEHDYEGLTARSGATHRVKVFADVISKTKSSPYLLYPEDNLVLCVNKHRSCASTWVHDNSEGVGTSRGWPNILLANHDVQILQGAVNITLYGDLIRNDREFHDTLNQRLETEELWETIGEEPVLDQFDVTYVNELSGSYIDRFSVEKKVPYFFFGQATQTTSSFESTTFYGNFSNVGDQASWATNRVTSGSLTAEWTNYHQVWELKSNDRNKKFVTNDEVFWDTRLPDPGGAFKVSAPGYQFGYAWDLSNNPNQLNRLLFAGPDQAGGTIFGIGDWFMSYPYESKYKNVTTVFATPNMKSAMVPAFSQGQSETLVDCERVTFVHDYNLSLTGSCSSPGLPDFLANMYGIGDGHSEVDNQYVQGRTLLRQVIVDPNLSGRGNQYGGFNLRGWKYGMLSAFPTNPTVVFRRDRFGQFRDMLEQRLDAKFYNQGQSFSNGQPGAAAGVKEGPIQVRFYDRAGNFTDPSLTLTSNLSFEATSSMPYTDGVARNRPPIDYNNLNISNVTV